MASEMTVLVHTVDALVEIVLDRLARTTEKRLVVLVGGVPGAGKSTLVERIVNDLETRHIPAQAVPQDGYHLYRSQLEQMDDPREAVRRRGAPFTFDAKRFVADVSKLLTDASVAFPLFDHAKKDPVENDIVVGPDVRIVFVEGNYVGLSEDPWGQLARVGDQLWFLRVDLELVKKRLVQRHVASGVCSSFEEATVRANGLDWQNAQYVMQHTRDADVDISLGECEGQSP